MDTAESRARILTRTRDTHKNFRGVRYFAIHIFIPVNSVITWFFMLES